ncbi:MAG: hypothetical protein IIT75_04270 [Candidatus Methanomethylophilus sp.]|nr:hypothetical protein [Methanomethylophilus sp.]MBQ5447392.1 hypothetical protein [Methanomethylophilus sp.]MBQ5483549.1 hypothetical protein [Methanomethylophilus sp.]
MEVKINLDEEEETLVNYYAETLGISVEEAFKGAIMYSIREMYKAQAAEEQEEKPDWADDPEEAADDLVLRDE